MAESCYVKTTPGTGMELMTDVLTYQRRCSPTYPEHMNALHYSSPLKRIVIHPNSNMFSD